MSARCGNSLIQQTRRMASSALVLAKAWRRIGYGDVSVVDSDGRPLTEEGYRDQVLRQRVRNRDLIA